MPPRSLSRPAARRSTPTSATPRLPASWKARRWSRRGRDLFGELAELLTGQRVAVESQHLSYADAARLQASGVELVPTSGLVEALRAVKDEPEVEAIRRAAAISDDVFAALAEERFHRQDRA
jgi:Xaa-Pro aminopeptidase